MNSIISTFRLDVDYLKDLAVRHREKDASANSFPYIVIDDSLPENILEEFLPELLSPDKINRQSLQTQAGKTLTSKHEQQKQIGGGGAFPAVQP